jgi:hypothetical protein
MERVRTSAQPSMLLKVTLESQANDEGPSADVAQNSRTGELQVERLIKGRSLTQRVAGPGYVLPLPT